MTQEDLNKLIAEVEADLALRKSEAFMDKDKEEKEDAKADAEADSMAAEASDAEAEHEEAPAVEREEDMPAEEAADEAEMKPDHEDQDMADEEGDVEDLEAIYSSMSPEELEEHYEALRAAMQKCWKYEHEESMKKDEMLSREENGKLPMMKSEYSGEIEALSKAEKIIKEQKEYIEELEKGLEALTKSISSKIPARKDITDIEVIKKSETETEFEDLEKSEQEIYSEAIKLARTQSLSKAERDVLNAYFTDRTKYKPVRELLSKKK
jgi:hypothetical protein